MSSMYIAMVPLHVLPWYHCMCCHGTTTCVAMVPLHAYGIRSALAHCFALTLFQTQFDRKGGKIGREEKARI